MIRYATKPGLLFTILVLMAVLGSAQAKNAAATADNSVPMTLGLMQDMQGEDKFLQDYFAMDKWLVVMFWASDCQYSNELVAQYNSHFAQSKVKNIEILGISLDGIGKKDVVNEFINRHNLKFDNLIGNRRSLTQFYGIMTGDDDLLTPTFVIFSPNGQLRARQIGSVSAKLIEHFINTETAQALAHKISLSY